MNTTAPWRPIAARHPLLPSTIRRVGAAAVLVLAVAVLPAARAQVGATFPTLHTTAGDFTAVKVLSVSPSAITIRHGGGIAQVPLKNLPPELQKQFGYDPTREAEHDKKVAEETQAQAAAAQLRQEAENAARKQALAAAAAARSGGDTPLDRAMARFGTPAAFQPIDFRPNFRELEMATTNQGPRPSCAVYAVVGALEFENARLVGKAEKLSEDYLVWATRRSLGLQPGQRRTVPGEDENSPARDAGFLLEEVLVAIRAYGIPSAAEMPPDYARFGTRIENFPEPPPEIIAQARSRRRVSTQVVPGVTNEVRIQNVMHVLNEGLPVVIGLRWPHWRTLLHAPLLAQQTPLPNAYHAVTLVGYYSETNTREGMRFVFRNSWGASWGVGGYGYVTPEYLKANLLDAVIVEVRGK